MGYRVLQHAVVLDALTRLRDKETKPAAFRRELDRLSFVMATEALRDLPVRRRAVETPLAETDGFSIMLPHALIPIMRAGDGMLGAFLTLLPDALVWHTTVARDKTTLLPKLLSSKIPQRISEDTGVCFVLDPMLATAGSASFIISELRRAGASMTQIRLVSVLAAPEGLDRIRRDHPDIQILLASLDARLNEHGYIYPGLGDAGDCQFPVDIDQLLT